MKMMYAVSEAATNSLLFLYHPEDFHLLISDVQDALDRCISLNVKLLTFIDALATKILLSSALHPKLWENL